VTTTGWTAETLEREVRQRGGSVTLAGSITAQTLALVLDVSARTLQRWAELDQGPDFYTVSGLANGRRYYRLVAVAAHLNQGARAA